MDAPMRRRDFLELTGLTTLAVTLGCAGDDPTDPDPDDPDDPETCALTSPDIEGPFWIAGVPVREDLDLYDHPGDRLVFEGRVVGPDCEPLPGAVVELWHADPWGDYDNSSTEMRYRGQVAADAEGGFRFTTVMPGYYPPRPLHLHAKVWVDGVAVLTTQIYFQGDPALTGSEKADLVIPLEEEDPGQQRGWFEFAVG